MSRRSAIGAKAEEPIADEAADAQRTAARFTNGTGQSRRLVFQIHMDSI